AAATTAPTGLPEWPRPGSLAPARRGIALVGLISKPCAGRAHTVEPARGSLSILSPSHTCCPVQDDMISPRCFHRNVNHTSSIQDTAGSRTVCRCVRAVALLPAHRRRDIPSGVRGAMMTRLHWPLWRSRLPNRVSPLDEQWRPWAGGATRYAARAALSGRRAPGLIPPWLSAHTAWRRWPADARVAFARLQYSPSWR